MAIAHKSTLASAVLAVHSQRSLAPASLLSSLLAIALMSAVVPVVLAARLEPVAVVVALCLTGALGSSAAAVIVAGVIGTPGRFVSAAASRTGWCSELSLQQPIAE
jgi:hypothetical protein